MTLVKRLKRALKPLLLPPLEAARRLLRREQLRRDLAHVDRASLLADLARLDLPAGSLVLVHSSLKSIGFVDGGADAVVEALIDYVVGRLGGTLAMPTFSIDGTMRNTLASGRVFDVRETPSNLGAIPEAFRRRVDARRSVHPTHSIAAIGPDAEWLVAEHHRAGSSFGRDTPMVRLLERGGLLMGIGTQLGTVTFYHCVEDLEPDYPLAVYSEDSPFTVTCHDWHGVPCSMRVYAHSPALAGQRIDRPENDTIRNHFTRQFERHAGLSWFDIGHTRGWLVPLPPMYAECVRLMRAGITIYSTPADLAARGAP